MTAGARATFPQQHELKTCDAPIDSEAKGFALGLHHGCAIRIHEWMREGAGDESMRLDCRALGRGGGLARARGNYIEDKVKFVDDGGR